MCVCLHGWGGWALCGVKGLRFDEPDISYLLFYIIHLMLRGVNFCCNNINGIDTIRVPLVWIFHVK